MPSWPSSWLTASAGTTSPGQRRGSCPTSGKTAYVVLHRHPDQTYLLSHRYTSDNFFFINMMTCLVRVDHDGCPVGFALLAGTTNNFGGSATWTTIIDLSDGGNPDLL